MEMVMRMIGMVVAGVMLVFQLCLSGLPASAAPIGKQAFKQVWLRTDLPVSELRVSRTWIWGPEAYSPPLYESYLQSPDERRVVQYFDKSRMEINDPHADASHLWYVTNGLLARELITGTMQVDDNEFASSVPAVVNVAGDPDDPDGPTYATFNGLLGYEPIPEGWHIIQTVNRAGTVGSDEQLASYGVTASHLEPLTNHRIASVFWEFMNGAGLVYQGGRYVEDRLYENPYYMTGLPLTEAYWTTARVGGVPRWVLVQVFERRVLTYTPGNPDGWQVEAGNVGQHYYHWRYGQLGETPAPAPSDPPAACVDINTAPKDELKRIIHIDENRAEQILQLRPFASVDDLIRVRGIGAARLRDIKEQGVACVS